MPDASVIAFDLVSGVLLGCVFAVIAHGLNLIWGVTKVVNIAHGEFIMLGAYGAFFLNVGLGLNPLLSAPVDALLGLGAGLAFYFLFLYRELRNKETVTLQSEMVTLVSTFGLSLFVSNVVLVVFTGNPRGLSWSPGTLDIGVGRVSLGAVYVAAASVAIIALTHVFLTRTYLGNAIRATSEDLAAAKVVGIDPTRTAALATGLGFAVTMAGGALLTVWLPSGIVPSVGAIYAPICFVIVVLGGPGKMWGSLAGGLAVGLVFDGLQPFLDPSVAPSIAQAAAVLILIPVLLFLPEGIVR